MAFNAIEVEIKYEKHNVKKNNIKKIVSIQYYFKKFQYEDIKKKENIRKFQTCKAIN